MKRKNLRVALVHDWLTGMRGGEQVLEVFCELFPEANLFTLLHIPGTVSETITRHPIHTSFINRLPMVKTRYRHYLPLFPTAIERFILKDYDLVLSTSHCVAKGIIPGPNTLHIAYLHTPMRYVWDMYEEYFGKEKVGFVTRTLISFFANYLRMWDVTSSQRVDYFIANSAHVAKRIKKYYRRSAEIIHPPVSTEMFRPASGNEGYDLILSALVPYKKVDLAIEAYNKMQRQLVVVGSGPEKDRLQQLAGPTIRFYDWQPAEKLPEFYQNCRALIFPGEEDFGIVPLEAMASGKPVIAFGKGGALETVVGVDNPTGASPTGVFFYRQTPESLIQAVEQSLTINWDAETIHRHARNFDRSVFKQKIQQFVSEKLSEHFHQ
ncbi:MAG: glycosyltransferase family 4 protein [Calditrichia bacterium]